HTPQVRHATLTSASRGLTARAGGISRATNADVASVHSPYRTSSPNRACDRHRRLTGGRLADANIKHDERTQLITSPHRVAEETHDSGPNTTCRNWIIAECSTENCEVVRTLDSRPALRPMVSESESAR